MMHNMTCMGFLCQRIGYYFCYNIILYIIILQYMNNYYLKINQAVLNLFYNNDNNNNLLLETFTPACSHLQLYKLLIL